MRLFKELPIYILNKLFLKYNNVSYGSGLKIRGKLKVHNKGSLSIGDNVIINSGYNYNPIGGGVKTSMIVKDNAYLSIGYNTGLSNVAIYCSENIKIGNNVKIGGGAKIYDTDFHNLNYSNRRLLSTDCASQRPVSIEDDVFIGVGVTILKGVTIGKCSIVGACSVVTKNIPPLEVWGGNPAKFIRKIGDFE